MMIRSSFYYLKVLIKNPLFLISCACLTILLFFIRNTLNISIGNFVKFFYYGFIIMNLYFLVVTTTMMNKEFKTDNYLERSMIKKQLITIIASFFIILAISIIPIIFILIFKNNWNDYETVKLGILHFLIIWILTNLLATTIGTTIGSIIKNTWSVLISILIYSFFIWQSLNLENHSFQKILNIYDDNIRVSANNLLGVIFNIQYILDKLFVVLILLFLLSVAGLFHHSRKRFLYVILASCCVITMVSITVYSANLEQNYTLEYPKVETDSYKVTSYNMNIDFSDELKNNVTMNIKLKDNVEGIVLLLDKIFYIKEIKINKLPVNYTFSNNRLVIDTQRKKGESIELNIKYEGNVFVNNDIGVPSYYVSNQSVNLPGEVFIWYPRNPVQEISTFTIKINSDLPLFSNLRSKEAKFYHGNRTNISFFAGPYKIIKHKNIEYIIPKSYDFEQFYEFLNSYINQLSNDNSYTKLEIKKIKNQKYKKVIVGVWPLGYDFLQLNDDTLMVDYLEF